MATKKKAEEHEDPKPEHLKAPDFRKEVENTAAGDLNQDPREPYPTGNPPDPKESFHRMHGRYPEEDKKDKKGEK